MAFSVAIIFKVLVIVMPLLIILIIGVAIMKIFQAIKSIFGK